jgi:preprotein translocase subunit SecD
MAAATSELEVVEGYLSEKIVFFLDDQQVSELSIGADLKGQPATEVQISVSGIGATREQAAINGKENMKRLQSVLVTGSLPVKLEIVKSDIIPASAGKLVGNAWLVGLIAFAAVALVIFIKYRKLMVALPVVFTSSSEVVLILWMAALIGWNLDLAAIAGIIIAVGTGVDHQIVIADEILRGEQVSNWKQKIKNAFFIILSSYFTTMAAMTPLLFAGAGLLRGFAITTMIGLSFGVFVTRPAFAAMIEILLKE